MSDENDLSEEEIARKVLERANRIAKIPTRGAEDIADKVFNETPPAPAKMEKVEIGQDPPLNVAVTPLEAFWGWIVGFAKQETVKIFEGKPVANPFSVISFFSNWKVIAIGAAVIGIVFIIIKLL